VEQPLLRLGLLGFAAPAADRLRAWAAQTQAGWPVWRESDPHRADAWMIDGAAVDVEGRDGLLIHHPQGSGDRLTLNRVEVDRPLAFATPLPEGFASAEFFDAADEHSVRQRLQRFEAWLRPLRTQFALGGRLIEQLPVFKRGVVHVLHDGRLLAVVDLDRWQAAGRAEVALYTVIGGGHLLPQPGFRAPRLLGPTLSGFDGPQAIWDFFARQRPAPAQP